MKLSEKTLNILKNFSTINPSIKISAGSVLSTISPTKTILAKATTDDVFVQSFCIYDLSQFLGTLSMFESPEIEFKDTHVVIKSGRQNVVFRFADESLIKVVPPSKELSFPVSDVSFDLQSADLTSVVKAAGVLTLPEIAFVGENGKLFIRTVNTKDVGSNKFDVEIGQTDKNFTAVFKNEYLMKLTAGSYKVDISSLKISRFVGDGITYWISIESNSTFE